MKIIYQNKEIFLIECKTFFQRLKGFMFETKIDHALMFNHCNSIHTFFMKQPIDVIFCNQENIILYYYKNLLPGKVILPKKKVKKVYELPINYYNFKIGDRLEIKK